MIPLAIFGSKSKLAKGFWSTVGLLILLSAWSGQLMDWRVALALTLFGAIVMLAQRRWATPAPAPSNPFCWRAVVATRGPGETYRARVGVLSFASETFDPVRCIPRAVRPGTAPLVPVDLPSTRGLHWLGQFQAKWADLEALRAQSCTFAAFLQFARVPFWKSEGEAMIAGDLRYNRESGLGFAELKWTGEGSCPKSPVPWLPPLTQSLSAKPLSRGALLPDLVEHLVDRR